MSGHEARRTRLDVVGIDPTFHRGVEEALRDLS